MFKKSTRLTLEILMAVITTVLLVVAGFMWRLSQGPMEIPSITRQLQSSLSEFSTDVDISIDKTILQWDGLDHPLSVHVLGVKALNKLGGEIAAVNEVSLDLSLPDLLIGRIIPTHINIMRPSLTVTRDETGQFDINVRTKQVAEEETKQNLGNDPLKEMLEILSDPKRQGVARKLESFTITNSEIFYSDIPHDFTLISPTSDIQLRRDIDGIEGVVTLNLSIGNQTEALRGQIDHQFKNQETKLSLAINDFNPKTIAQLSPNFENAENFDVPLTGVVDIAINNLFQILSFNVIADGKAGKITVSQFYDSPLEIDGANLDVSYNPNDGSVFMKQFAVDMDGFKADIQGRLTQSLDEGVLFLEAKAGLFNIGADQLPQYWPQGLARGARNWITKNISDGTVPKAVAELKISAPITDLSLMDIETLQGNLFVEGATVNYLKPMTPVKGVDGIANFTRDTFAIELSSGKIRDTVLKKGQVTIRNLDQKVPNIEIDLTTDGKLSDGLFLVGSKPLELTKNMGLNYIDFTGQAETDLYLAFPLLKNLLKSQVKVKTSANITNVKGNNIVGNNSVTSEKLELKADNEKMTIKGKALLADIPIDLNWSENFGDDAPYIRQMKATGQVTAENIKKITNLDLSAYLISPFQATAIIQETKAGAESTAIDLNLKNTAIEIPQIDYQKMAGEAARLSFNIIEPKSDQTDLRDIDINAPDLIVKGDVSFKSGVLASLNFSEFKNNGSDATINLLKEKDRYNIIIGGQSLDAREAWRNIRQSKKEKQIEGNDKVSQYPPISLAANVKKLRLSDNQNLQNVKAAVELYPDRIHRMEVDAIAGNGDVYLRYTPFENGEGYQLRMETPDAGAALNAFGLTNKISGGTMIVDAASAVNESDLIVGGLTIKNYKIIKAPILGRLLNALSPVGLVELLDNDGISFLALESKWYYKNNILNFQTGRMAGASLGLNYDGSVNLETNYMDIKGTIVPIDPVNRVIGKLPVIGTILGGVSGDGLFAATYTIKGITDDPKVSVNPLAALAPGILRSIFFENSL